MVALGWHLGLCTGALSQKRNEGYYIINEAQMYIQSELKVVLLPSTHLFQQVPGLFISIGCSSSVNPGTAFCFSTASPVREGATVRHARRIYPWSAGRSLQKQQQQQNPSLACGSLWTLNMCIWVWTASAFQSSSSPSPSAATILAWGKTLSQLWFVFFVLSEIWHTYYWICMLSKPYFTLCSLVLMFTYFATQITQGCHIPIFLSISHFYSK